MNELESNRFQTMQQVGAPPLTRSWFFGRYRLKLKVPQQVVPQDRDLLPSRVGRIMPRRHHIQGPLSFEFGKGLLLRTPTPPKVPQSRRFYFEIGGHSRVLVVPVVRVKQIELVVLLGLMMNRLSVHN